MRLNINNLLVVKAVGRPQTNCEAIPISHGSVMCRGSRQEEIAFIPFGMPPTIYCCIRFSAAVTELVHFYFLSFVIAHKITFCLSPLVTKKNNEGTLDISKTFRKNQV